ncbi:hypothetical protein LR48_Vigan10g129400 [Vigna angularis]|uniref:Uncharacterized protein n=1 Tax=Phaseolus angularis TaxID=3914 RepID=A0A0L9VKF3_PHAAN|nr:hypothetical protein LR48_Vigan10g129400 [Vigna angularis]
MSSSTRSNDEAGEGQGYAYDAAKLSSLMGSSILGSASERNEQERASEEGEVEMKVDAARGNTGGGYTGDRIVTSLETTQAAVTGQRDDEGRRRGQERQPATIAMSIGKKEERNDNTSSGSGGHRAQRRRSMRPREEEEDVGRHK